MLSLQSVIRNLPFLRKALANSNSQLLQIMHEVCKGSRYQHDLYSMDSSLADDLGQPSCAYRRPYYGSFE
jgi:hypothetical protein